MKLLGLMIVALVLFSCTNKVEHLEWENQKLTKELSRLKSKLKKYDNAFIIPFDSITDYMMPCTYGKLDLKRGENNEYTTTLIWSKFPKGIIYDWKINKGLGILKNVDKTSVMKQVRVRYLAVGEKEEQGAYCLLLPNGHKKVLTWIKPTTVK